MRGARQNSLKNLSLDIPLGQIVVVTGVSGSGKSSLVFDTIYAEGQRRYIETFSAYARQFLDRMDRPQVDRIDGVPPAIAIDQTNPVRSSRSTVGTMTELADHLKLLYARTARLICPGCSQPVRRDGVEGIVQLALAQPDGTRLGIAFERSVPDSLDDAQLADWLSALGFTKLHTRLPGLVRVLVDRLVIREDLDRSRLAEGIEAALRAGDGACQLVLLAGGEPAGDSVLRFSTALACEPCGLRFREARPALFSFNSPIGACEACRGFGRVIGIDPGLVVPDERLSLAKGAIKPWQSKSYADCQSELLTHAAKRGVALDIPWKDLPPEDQAWVFNGDEDWKGSWTRQWYGVHRFFEHLETKSYKMHVRVMLSRYRSYTPCPSCKGARLKPESLNWQIVGRRIDEVMSMSLDSVWAWLDQLEAEADPHRDSAQQAATALVMREARARLSVCRSLGLGYLSLDRQSRTLSGGEVQRINLSTALGTSLVNTLFVLDEPSIGLHPRDLQRLIRVLKTLRDAGNHLLIVEHDPEVMEAADQILDMGPGPGDRGGEVLFQGSPEALLREPGLTGDYLSGRRRVSHELPAPRAQVEKAPRLILRNVRAHNLKGFDFQLPLNHLVVLTGVSGSGKSTLVQDVLYPALCKAYGRATDAPGAHDGLEGASRLADAILVDQSPIGRTTRSNPAVFMGAFDGIRHRFAAAPLSVQRGYTSGTFSFNTGTGRCPTCAGSGFEQVEMQFLSDVYLSCPDCKGRRYRDETLEVRVEGRSISDVLDMTVQEALSFFSDQPEVTRRLQPLVDVGLDYLRLGQPVPTLSGGEAQRLKIASHLADAAERGGRVRKGMLLIFDEPSTGLHFEDISRLLKSLRALVKAGHSLLVVEHNLDLIRSADWLIDLGPEAGEDGGRIVCEGQQEDLIACRESHTGMALWRAIDPAASRCPAEEGPPLMVAEAPVLPGGLSEGAIRIQGAREHNLKSLSVDIPHQQLTVITGVSGSGKSTLAFDILFAEGQRRYLESLNAYARQFVQPASRPDVDAIHGIPPTVAIEQRTSRGGHRSTVGTLTEIHHYLRLLFMKLGQPHCPDCDVPIEPQSPESILATLLREHRGQTLTLLAPLVQGRKGIYQDLARWAESKGYAQLRVDGDLVPTSPFPKLDRYKVHTIELPMGEFVAEESAAAALLEGLLAALDQGQGSLSVLTPDTGLRFFSSRRSCPSCGLGLPEPDPRQFSYNSPLGWCHRCTGTGLFGLKLKEGETGEEERHQQSAEQSLTDDTPADLPLDCPECEGSRLNPTARAVRLRGGGIDQVSRLPVGNLHDWVTQLEASLDDRGKAIAEGLLSEIRSRAAFLTDVGLGYLALDRAAPTLSGGEAQRIRLAAQLGSNLQGVCYVLDEPSIGLHPRDNLALLRLLRTLQQRGNTVVVVEHDEATMAIADHLIDIGPGAGKQGGQLVVAGSLDDLKASAESRTGACLRSPPTFPPAPRRPPTEAEHWLDVEGASLHNLQGLSVRIPLGRITCVTGVSGSGKSTLVRSVVGRNLLTTSALQRTREGRAKGAPAWQGCSSITGWSIIQRVVEVDQTPIGKTSRSTPATYLGLWDEVRRQLAESEEARMRGWAAGRFSFNTGDGRCEACEGQGWQTMEMNFLPDVRVLCDACNGARFNSETRQMIWRGRPMGEILQMTVDEALEFFDGFSNLKRPLQLMADLGLGYLSLGQPSATLSGGEAQRLKLVTELSRAKNPGHTLYVLDEPTVGLHLSDVSRLLSALHRLADAGHSLLVIEHAPEVWMESDWLIELGPEGGEAGGRLVAMGTPQEVAQRETATGRALSDR